jgi:hypothetical protein
VSEPTVFVVHEFSVRPADQAEIDAALAVIVSHIREEHPEVLSCQTYKQWVGPAGIAAISGSRASKA